jgi:hypothetical protein
MHFRRHGWLAGWIFCVSCSSGTTGSQPSLGGAAGAGGADASNLGGNAGSGTGGSMASNGSGGHAGTATGGSADSGETHDGSRDSVDARPDALTSDAAELGDAGVCATCTGNEVCVEHQIVGGAVHPLNDAGRCDDGFVIVPEAPFTCSRPPTFQCAQLPSTCNTNPAAVAVAHCTCASSLCAASSCTDVTPTLMRCVQSVP